MKSFSYAYVFFVIGLSFPHELNFKHFLKTNNYKYLHERTLLCISGIVHCGMSALFAYSLIKRIKSENTLNALPSKTIDAALGLGGIYFSFTTLQNLYYYKTFKEYVDRQKDNTQEHSADCDKEEEIPTTEGDDKTHTAPAVEEIKKKDDEDHEEDLKDSTQEHPSECVEEKKEIPTKDVDTHTTSAVEDIEEEDKKKCEEDSKTYIPKHSLDCIKQVVVMPLKEINTHSTNSIQRAIEKTGNKYDNINLDLLWCLSKQHPEDFKEFQENNDINIEVIQEIKKRLRNEKKKIKKNKKSSSHRLPGPKKKPTKHGYIPEQLAVISIINEKKRSRSEEFSTCRRNMICKKIEEMGNEDGEIYIGPLWDLILQNPKSYEEFKKNTALHNKIILVLKKNHRCKETGRIIKPRKSISHRLPGSKKKRIKKDS